MKSPVLHFASLSASLPRSQTQAVMDRIQDVLPRAVCRTDVFHVPVVDCDKHDLIYTANCPHEIDFLAGTIRDGQARLMVVEASDLNLPLPDGLDILCVPDRQTPFDAFLNRQGLIMDEMDPGSRIGVLGVRSKAQLSALWPDMVFRILPGGVDMAMEIHLRRSEVDGLVLPAAVAEHLGIQSIVAEIFSPEFVLPGPGQGILVVLGLASDAEARRVLSAVHSVASEAELTAELAFRASMIQDRDLPVGALARVTGDQMVIVGATGRGENRISVTGRRDEAAEVGAGLASQILCHGASFADLLEAEFPDGLPPSDDTADFDDDFEVDFGKTDDAFTGEDPDPYDDAY